MKRKKVYFITVVIEFAICMVGVIFGSRLVFQRICKRRTTPYSNWVRHSIIIAILILLIMKRNTVINIVKNMLGKKK